MAAHRRTARRLRWFRAVILMALAVVLDSALVGQPAGADVTVTPKAKIVKPSNENVIASCKFQVNRVANNTVYFTMTANARPADLDGYRANAFTQVRCYLLPGGHTNPNDAFFWVNPSTNGATLLPTSYNNAVGYLDSYTVCGSALVKLKNGDTSYTPYVCA